jgi:hypothetical protein
VYLAIFGEWFAAAVAVAVPTGSFAEVHDTVHGVLCLQLCSQQCSTVGPVSLACVRSLACRGRVSLHASC